MRKSLLVLLIVVMVLISGCSVINRVTKRYSAQDVPKVHVSAIMGDSVLDSPWGPVLLNPFQDTLFTGRPASVTVLVRFDHLPAGEHTARAEFTVAPATNIPELATLLAEQGMTMADYAASPDKAQIDEAYQQYSTRLREGWVAEESFPVEGQGSIDSFSATAIFVLTIAAWEEGTRTIDIYLDDRLVYQMPIQFISEATAEQASRVEKTR